MSYSLAHRLYALCSDTRSTERVHADMGRMLERRGVSVAALQADPHQWLEAKTRCAACANIDRCHSFLDGGADDPAEFCGNTEEFATLRMAD